MRPLTSPSTALALLLLAVITSALNTVDESDRFVLRQGTSVTISIRAYRTQSRKILCYDHGVTPTIDVAWFGLTELSMNKRCEDVIVRPDWEDMTQLVRGSCVHAGGKAGAAASCRLPSRIDFDEGRKRLLNSNETLYWLVCYTCQEPKDDEDVDDILEQEMNGETGRSLEDRKTVAEKYMERKVGGLVPDEGVKPASPASAGSTTSAKPDLEAILRRTEATTGRLTTILRDREAMQINVRRIGTVNFVRLDSGGRRKANDVLWASNDVTVRSMDGYESVAAVAVVHFNPAVWQTSDGNVTSIVAVSVFDADGVISDGRRSDGGDVVAITFNDTSPDVAKRCVFWDFSLSGWSSEGCRLDRSGSRSGEVTCRCRHLTNFALLLDYAFDGADEANSWQNDVLRVLTLVGCGLSALGLAAAVIYFCTLKPAERTDRVCINIHFCLNLLAVQLLMLFGVEQTDVAAVCSAVAVALHLSLLTTFAWSLAATHHVYALIVEVFDAERGRMAAYTLAAYAFPVAVVVVCVAVDWAVMDGATYGSADFCWMRHDTMFVAAFLAPMCAVLLVNTVVLATVMFKVCKIKPRPYAFGQARGWLSLVLLLGGTWLLGVLGKLYPSFATAVVFVLLNSLQGFLIFVFHVVLGQRCRKRMADLVAGAKETKSKSGATATKSTTFTFN